MNALEDTRELVTTTSAPDKLGDLHGLPSRLIAGFVDDLLYKWPDVELSTIRITNLDGILTVTGRRGTLASSIECPQCHQPIGRPHTEFCTLAPDRVWAAGHHLVHSEAFVDQDDPRSRENREYPGQPATGPYTEETE
jgi:hypothetical protein